MAGYTRVAIEAGPLERPLFGSVLGQSGNPHPTDACLLVIRLCLRLGYDAAIVHKPTGANATELMS